MAKERFIRELFASGIAGRFKGTIEVLFDNRLETKEVHNRILHEEEIKTLYYHVVNGYVGDAPVASIEFADRSKVWEFISKVQDVVDAKINALSNTVKQLTLEEDLVKHGFIKQ